MAKRKTYTRRGFGILNPWGDLWTGTVFDNEAEARIYFDRFWSSPGFEKADKDFSKYKVVPVSSTTQVVNPPPPEGREP